MICKELKFEVALIAIGGQRVEHGCYVQQAVGWLIPLEVRWVTQSD